MKYCALFFRYLSPCKSLPNSLHIAASTSGWSLAFNTFSNCSIYKNYATKIKWKHANFINKDVIQDQ